MKRRCWAQHIEFSVAVLLETKMIPSSIIKEYFPKDPEHIDRQFLIDVWYNQDPFRAKKYYDLVMDSKIKAKIPQVYKMEFPEDMLDDLLKYQATRK